MKVYTYVVSKTVSKEVSVRANDSDEAMDLIYEMEEASEISYDEDEFSLALQNIEELN